MFSDWSTLTNPQFQLHLQTQATQKMEGLTTNMHDINVLSQKEAISMRIVTIVTMIYLPATFVSVRPQATYYGTVLTNLQDLFRNRHKGPRARHGSGLLGQCRNTLATDYCSVDHIDITYWLYGSQTHRTKTQTKRYTSFFL